MEKTLVAIPWRDTGDVYRTESMNFVRGWLSNINNADDVVLVDGDGDKFSLSAARNKACDLAIEGGYTSFVVCDSDTLPDINAVHAAIEVAEASNRVVLPFTLYRALGQQGSQMVIRGGLDPYDCKDILGELDWSTGGVHVSSPETWIKLGGQDERFTGWGCEDFAFYYAAEKMGMPHVRIAGGTIHHLWHPSSPDKDERTPSYIVNEELLRRYVDTNDIEGIIGEHTRYWNERTDV